MRGNTEITKDSHYHNKTMKESMLELKNIVLELREEVRPVLFQSKMETTDISQYFPANNNEMIEAFLVQDDDFQQ